MSFTLKELLNETSYDNLVNNYSNPEQLFYDVSVFYNESSIANVDRPKVNNSKYYYEYVPYVFKNERNEYVIVDSNLQAIVNSLINVIKTYNVVLTYDTNPYLDSATINGDLLDYEVVVSSTKIKITNFNSNKGFLSPFKYEIIVKELDETESTTAITLYSTIDSFPYKKNDYFMTIYSLFKDYMLKKVTAEDRNEINRISDFLNTTTSMYEGVIGSNVIGTYLKFNTSTNEYVTTEHIDINTIVDDIADFPINDNDGFVSGDYTYIKLDEYSDTLLLMETDPLDILTYNEVNGWEVVSTPNTFNPVTTSVTISSVDGDEAVVDEFITVGQYISDGTNSYKMLSINGTPIVSNITITNVNEYECTVNKLVSEGDYIYDGSGSGKFLIESVTPSGDNFNLVLDKIGINNSSIGFTSDLTSFTITYSKTVNSDDITIGTNFTFAPTLNNDQLTSIESSRALVISNVVNNLQVFIYDFELTAVDIIDLQYYKVSLDSENVNYKYIHDAILNYIKIEQDKIVDMIYS